MSGAEAGAEAAQGMDGGYVWTVILGLGLVTYLIRFSGLGLLGAGAPPPWLARALAYVPTAVLPAIIAPLVAFDRATGGVAAPHAFIAAGLALAVGAWLRSLLPAILAGMAAFHLLRFAGL
ncbi:AzlD domain-containing protein [Rubrimonas cliftonensis]|uniref:Branched-chain amino acid transport protein n=1 Tax=Rubrimonas cliftonensis TaxID=89524 RepID=A0A1H4BW31_9RHOB|nr:AzlD domain-containing protein [Rubrimonas cliftonensis]SEA52283.1 Branched-chain amino acid transport protein [Rubrimonas cliftonensis]